MKAPYLLTENVLALIKQRGLKQHDVADYCHHSDVWLSYVLSGKRGVRLVDLDRMADILGVVTYQLFQPGVSRTTERRIAERRARTDRRVSHAGRIAQDIRARLAEPEGEPHGRRVPAPPAPVQRILQEAERRIAAYYATQGSPREQAPVARKRRPRKSA